MFPFLEQPTNTANLTPTKLTLSATRKMTKTTTGKCGKSPDFLILDDFKLTISDVVLVLQGATRFGGSFVG